MEAISKASLSSKANSLLKPTNNNNEIQCIFVFLFHIPPNDEYNPNLYNIGFFFLSFLETQHVSFYSLLSHDKISTIRFCKIHFHPLFEETSKLSQHSHPYFEFFEPYFQQNSIFLLLLVFQLDLIPILVSWTLIF